MKEWNLIQLKNALINPNPLWEGIEKEYSFIVEDEKSVKENPFMGKNLCVTGKLNHFTRDSDNRNNRSSNRNAYWRKQK